MERRVDDNGAQQSRRRRPSGTTRVNPTRRSTTVATDLTRFALPLLLCFATSAAAVFVADRNCGSGPLVAAGFAPYCRRLPFRSERRDARRKRSICDGSRDDRYTHEKGDSCAPAVLPPPSATERVEQPPPKSTPPRRSAGATGERRTFLRASAASLASASTAPLLLGRTAALAEVAGGNEGTAALDPATTLPDFDCLLDLPPPPKDFVRLYLCRHGQTENNRLRLVQGARIDPSLNDTGRNMALRVGLALSRLKPDCTPAIVESSSLRRAKETARIASLTIAKARREDSGIEWSLGGGSVPVWASGDRDEKEEDAGLKVGVLPALGEVDFGPMADGQKVQIVRASMLRTYGAWSAGLVDARPRGGGESAREILNRASSALWTLAEEARSSPSGSIVAVSHSTYLRTLLSTVLDMPLSKAASLEVKNGCINVLDVNPNNSVKMEASTTNLFGAGLAGHLVSSVAMLGRPEFSLTLPETRAVRINETRHLAGLI